MNRKAKLITMRHEDKYLCTDRQLLLLESRLKTFLEHDSHQKGDFYNIRSLYLDTEDNRFLEESLAGVSLRKKYRIRIYDHSDKRISLEEKSSEGNLKSKRSALVDRNYVLNAMEGCFADCPQETLKLSDDGNRLITQIHVLATSQGLKPAVIVDYDRTAFVYNVGNVRITLDRNISASCNISGFFDPDIVTVPILPKGKSLMEVKYDGILPGFIARILDTGALSRVSFSKYGLCQNVIEYNGRREEYYVI